MKVKSTFQNITIAKEELYDVLKCFCNIYDRNFI